MEVCTEDKGAIHSLNQLIVIFLSAPFRFYTVETKASETWDMTLAVESISTYISK